MSIPGRVKGALMASKEPDGLGSKTARPAPDDEEIAPRSGTHGARRDPPSYHLTLTMSSHTQNWTTLRKRGKRVGRGEIPMLDPHKLSTVKIVAERIASRHNASPDSVARLLRGLTGSNVIRPSTVPQSGPTAPNLFDEAGIYRAAILVTLNRLGLSDDMLAAVGPRLNNLEGFQDDGLGDRNDGKSPDRLWRVLRDVSEGCARFCHVYLVPAYFDRAGNVLGVTFSERSDGGQPHPFFSTTITIPLLGLVSASADRKG